MSLLIQIETVHRTYTEPSESFVRDKNDIASIKKLLGKLLKYNPLWVSAICEAIPFNHGDDTFLISPEPSRIMSTNYRGKIVRISTIK